jgi:flagellar protein FlaJ
MTAIATAGVSRSSLFEYAARLPYASAQYFRNINFVARHLNVDYAQACRMEADKTSSPEVRSLLLRIAGSLLSGEDERRFLRREAEIIGESYGNQYAREVESLKKWTDAYVALIVAASLIVIVAVISMMIYEVGMVFVIALAVGMVGVSCLGAWVIYVSAPKEIKTRASGPSSKLQKRGAALFKVLTPLAVIAGALIILLGADLGWALIAGAILLFPIGLTMQRDDGTVTRKDDDIPSVVRVLGGVTGATGTTVADALDKIDRRSMGNLAPEVTRLRSRLKAGIDPALCWGSLVDETGSELIERTVQMFWDSISVGGDPADVGDASAFFSSRIAFLRANRQMVAATFQWLTLPLQIALTGLLQFIVEIMTLFTLSLGTGVLAVDESSASTLTSGTSVGMPDVFAFGQVNILLVDVLVTSLILVISATNAFAPNAAAGGHPLKILFNLSINMAIAGGLMVIVPMLAGSVFNSILTSTP